VRHVPLGGIVDACERHNHYDGAFCRMIMPFDIICNTLHHTLQHLLASSHDEQFSIINIMMPFATHTGTHNCLNLCSCSCFCDLFTWLVTVIIHPPPPIPPTFILATVFNTCRVFTCVKGQGTDLHQHSKRGFLLDLQ